MNDELWYQDSWYEKAVDNLGWTCTGTLLRRQWIKKASFIQLHSGEGEFSDFSGDLVHIRSIQLRRIEIEGKQLKLF